MTAPSKVHQDRVALLRDMAQLAGLLTDRRLGVGLMPDVVRTDESTRLMVADAKATETPGCSATARRLRRYGIAVENMLAGGLDVRLALAVDVHFSPRLWWELLEDVAPRVPIATRGHLLVDDTDVVWVDLSAG